MQKHQVYIVSDSVGETGEIVVRAALSQFIKRFEKVELTRFPHTTTIEQIDQIVKFAIESKAVIVFTLVEKDMRKYLYNLSVENDIVSYDLLGPMMEIAEKMFNQKPFQKPGLVHRLDDDYFKKIEAIEFAVKYDDGRDPRGVLQADIVLIGVSRTSKTPLSQYLAHKSYKVANIPIVPEVDPPKELFEVNAKKCFGLIINPDKLNCIRKERLLALGLKEEAIYAQRKRIEQELEYFHKLAKKIGCHVVDVTNTAIEESANYIIDVFEHNNLTE